MSGTQTVSTAVTATASDWLMMNHLVTPFNARYATSIAGTGDRTFSVQFTLDPTSSLNAASTAYDIVSAQSAGGIGIITEPATGLRLLTTAGSGVATVSLQVLQAG